MAVKGLASGYEWSWVLVVLTLTWFPLLTQVLVTEVAHAHIQTHTHTATIPNTHSSCMGHYESFYHALPQVSSKRSEWGELTFSDTLNTSGWPVHMLMTSFFVESWQGKRQSERERERIELSPVVQPSAPIRIKSKAAEPWCHGWPLEAQTCHFGYRPV